MIGCTRSLHPNNLDGADSPPKQPGSRQKGVAVKVIDCGCARTSELVHRVRLHRFETNENISKVADAIDAERSLLLIRRGKKISSEVTFVSKHTSNNARTVDRCRRCDRDRRYAAVHSSQNVARTDESLVDRLGCRALTVWVLSGRMCSLSLSLSLSLSRGTTATILMYAQVTRWLQTRAGLDALQIIVTAYDFPHFRPVLIISTNLHCVVRTILGQKFLIFTV